MLKRIHWLLAMTVASACTVSTAPAPSRPYEPPREAREHRPPPPPREAPLPEALPPAGPPPEALPSYPPPPPRARSSEHREWDSTGWISLGEHTVDGRVDSDQFDFSQKQGKISKIMVVVLDGDLEMLEFRIVSVNGDVYNPQTRHFFHEGARTRPIDLPRSQILRAVQLKYKNLGRGRARVQVWAR